MAILFDRKNHSDADAGVGEGDGVLNAFMVALLIAVAFGSWYLYGSVQPMVEAANPSLIVQPASAPGAHSPGPAGPAMAASARTE